MQITVDVFEQECDGLGRVMLHVLEQHGAERRADKTARTFLRVEDDDHDRLQVFDLLIKAREHFDNGRGDFDSIRTAGGFVWVH